MYKSKIKQFANMELSNRFKEINDNKKVDVGAYGHIHMDPFRTPYALSCNKLLVVSDCSTVSRRQKHSPDGFLQPSRLKLVPQDIHQPLTTIKYSVHKGHTRTVPPTKTRVVGSNFQQHKNTMYS